MNRTLTAALAAATTVVAVTALAGAPAAHAESNIGVHHVTFDSTPRFCPSPAGALPAGFGGAASCAPGQQPSNTVYVVQTMTPAGWRYTHLVGTGSTDGDASVLVTVEGKCRATHRLHAALIGAGAVSGDHGSALQTSPYWDGFPVSVNPSHVTLPEQLVDVDIDVDTLEAVYFGTTTTLAGTGTSFVERGEMGVAADVAAGVAEADRRLASYSEVVHVGMHVALGCHRVTNHSRVRWLSDGGYVPVEIVYLGAGQEPGPGWRDAAVEPPVVPGADRPAPGGLTEGNRVTQAHLSVLVDPGDPCRLMLSGVLSTNAAMTVEYRIVDHVGVGSQVFSVAVDQTHVVFLDHHVDLPVVGADGGPGGPGGLAADEPQASDFGLVAADSDNVQGYYRIHVIAPHGKWSNVAGYNVEPCVASAGLRAAVAWSTAVAHAPMIGR